MFKAEIVAAFVIGWIVADQVRDWKRAQAADHALTRLGVPQGARRGILDLF